jgi:hypothetical protein
MRREGIISTLRSEVGLLALAFSQKCFEPTWKEWYTNAQGNLHSTDLDAQDTIRIGYDSSESTDHLADRVRAIVRGAWGDKALYTYTLQMDDQSVEINRHTPEIRIGGPAPLTDKMLDAFRLKVLSEYQSNLDQRDNSEWDIDRCAGMAVYHTLNVLHDEAFNDDTPINELLQTYVRMYIEI